MCVVDPTWKRVILDRALPPFELGHQAPSYIKGDLKLDGTTGLLLDDNGACPDLRSGSKITNLDLEQIAAAKLIIDCQIEQSTITDAALAIEEEANSPNLLQRERTLRADFFPAFHAARSRLVSSYWE